VSILIVGGAGVIGGDAALNFRAAGRDVTIAGRREPKKGGAYRCDVTSVVDAAYAVLTLLGARG
jgi:predicted dinucleotide-binding enzyme